MIGESSKRAKINASNSAVSIDVAANAFATTTTTKVAVPSTSMNSLTEVQTSEPPMEREEEVEKKKKKRKEKSAIAKVRCKIGSRGSNDSDKVLEKNPFNNRGIIKRLIDWCTLPKVMDRIIKADLKQRIWDSLGSFLEVNQFVSPPFHSFAGLSMCFFINLAHLIIFANGAPTHRQYQEDESSKVGSGKGPRRPSSRDQSSS